MYLWNKFPSVLHVFTIWSSMKKETIMPIYNEYVTMKIYSQNRLPYREQDWIPFWHYKCIGTRQVIFNLPSKLAQAVNFSLLSGGLLFKYRPGHRISWQFFFVIFLSHSKKTVGYLIKLRQLVIHKSSCPSGLLYVSLSILEYTASSDVMDLVINWKGSGRKW
jgi:hypothetical protein